MTFRDGNEERDLRDLGLEFTEFGDQLIAQGEGGAPIYLYIFTCINKSSVSFFFFKLGKFW